MTATEWRERSRAASEVVELSLPSGMVIQARRPGPMQFAGWSKLPLMLAVLEKGETASAMSVEETTELAKFMVDLLAYCCVEPRIALGSVAGPDEILPMEVADEDWQFILRWALRVEEAAALRSFRRVGTDGRGGGDGEGIRSAAVGAAGVRGPGASASDRPGGGEAGGGVGEGGSR